MGVSILDISSENELSSVRRKAIAWIEIGLLLI